MMQSSTDSGRLQRLALSLCLAGIIAIPALLVFLYIGQNTQNVPWLDQWHPSVVLALKTVHGQITLQDLFYQHNEHRIFFTNLVTVLLTAFTRWDIRLEAYLSWGLAVVNLGLLAAIFRLFYPRGTLLVIALFSLLVLSMRQSIGWLFGFMNCWYFLNGFFLLAIYVLLRGSVGWKALFTAVGLGACAVFSLGNGLLAMLLLSVAMWAAGYRARRYYAFWLGASVIVIGLFFWDYHFIPRAAIQPLPVAQYIITMLGAPLVTSNNHPQELPLVLTLARITGVTGIFALAVNALILFIRRENRKILLTWLVIAALPAASAAISAPNRVHLAVGEALQSKNVIVTHLFWVAVVGSSYSVWAATKTAVTGGLRLYRLGLAGLCVALLPLYAWGSYRESLSVPIVTKAEYTCYLAYPSTRNMDCLDRTYFLDGDASAILEKIDHLAVHRLTAFAYADDALIPPALAENYVHLPYDLNNPIYLPYVSLAQQFTTEGNIHQALAYYDEAFRVNPASVPAYVGRAELYTTQGDYEQALADYSRAAALAPGNTYILAKRGELYLQLGRAEAALQDYKAILTIEPDNALALERIQQLTAQPNEG